MNIEEYIYTIKMKDENLQWKTVGNAIFSDRYVVDDMVPDETYKFCVNAKNRNGESFDSVISYIHM